MRVEDGAARVAISPGPFIGDPLSLGSAQHIEAAALSPAIGLPPYGSPRSRVRGLLVRASSQWRCDAGYRPERPSDWRQHDEQKRVEGRSGHAQILRHDSLPIDIQTGVE